MGIEGVCLARLTSTNIIYYNRHIQHYEVIEQRISEVRKGTSKNTENENKRRKIFNKVLNMNWDYVRGKKTKWKIKINVKQFQ
jgi:hypothetical protein